MSRDMKKFLILVMAMLLLVAGCGKQEEKKEKKQVKPAVVEKEEQKEEKIEEPIQEEIVNETETVPVVETKRSEGPAERRIIPAASSRICPSLPG